MRTLDAQARARESVDSLDMDTMRAELDGIQRRLDLLAQRGTNPYEIVRLQHTLNAARAELQSLSEDSAQEA